MKLDALITSIHYCMHVQIISIICHVRKTGQVIQFLNVSCFFLWGSGPESPDVSLGTSLVPGCNGAKVANGYNQRYALGVHCNHCTPVRHKQTTQKNNSKTQNINFKWGSLIVSSHNSIVTCILDMASCGFDMARHGHKSL